MRENRTSGSEGGGTTSELPTPIEAKAESLDIQLKSNLVALKGRLQPALAPLQG